MNEKNIEQASVGQEQKNQPVQPTQLVDADDLVWALGHDRVEKIGYRKLVEQNEKRVQAFIQENQTLKNKIVEETQKAQKAEEQLQQNKKSLDRLDVTNQSLADELKRVRAERDKEIKEVKEERDALQKEIDRRDKISGKNKKSRSKTKK